MKLSRRSALAIVGAAGLSAAGLRYGFVRAARPAEPDGPLSRDAEAFLDRAWEGIDPARTLDVHTHVVGLGVGGTGCWVNPRMTQWARHPVHYAKFLIYQRASGITDTARADAQYVENLVGLIRSQKRHGRHLILAFDQVYGEDGQPRPDDSEFFTPNDYVLKLAREYPDCFVAGASVHPYRADAVDELHRLAESGAVAVKWLPNAQQMDASSARCDGYFDALAKLGLPLITHVGEEQAVHAEEAQKLGNPLHFRRPLDRGVKVVMAHCASLGTGEDLDQGGAAPPRVENLDLFLRLMGEERYRGQLFGDVSALPQYNRADRPLREMLSRADLHERLVNGSDYPLPAINALTRTGVLLGLGYLNGDDRRLLNELDRHNPLAFDFALKRTLRVTKDDVEQGFGREVFMPPAELFPRLRPA